MPRDALDYWIFAAGFACCLLVVLVVQVVTLVLDAPWRMRRLYRNAKVNRAWARWE